MYNEKFLIRYEFKEVIKEIPRVEVKYIEKKVEVPQVMVSTRALLFLPRCRSFLRSDDAGAMTVCLRPPVCFLSSRGAHCAGLFIHVLRLTDPIQRHQPKTKVRDIPVEVPEVQEVTRMIPRIVVKEVPIERVRRVEKVVYQDVEEIEYVPVPYIVQIQKKKPQGPRGEGLGVDSGGLTPGGVHPGVLEGGGPSTSSSSSSGPAPGGLTQPGGGGPTAVIASSGLDVNVKVKSEVHLFENVNQVTKPKLVPIEKEVPEYVPQYIDVDVDEYG